MDERAKVIEFIKKEQGTRFRVFDNTLEDKKVIAGYFPDIIFKRLEPPPNNDILFVMKIEVSSDNLLDNIAEWKALGSAPSTFYIVAAKDKLDEVKRFASALNVRARFASYEITGDIVTSVNYE